LGKLGLAAILDQAGKRSEATDTRQDVAKTCLSLDGEALAAAREAIEQLIPHLEKIQDVMLGAGGLGLHGGLVLKLKKKLEVLKPGGENPEENDHLRRRRDAAKTNS
jgi:hypothetical protein